MVLVMADWSLGVVRWARFGVVQAAWAELAAGYKMVRYVWLEFVEDFPSRKDQDSLP